MNHEEKEKGDLIRKLVEIRRAKDELDRTVAQNRLVEEELLNSEKRYRTLVELSPDMIALHSRGKYVYVNPAGIKLLRASDLNALTGKSIFRIIHPDYREIARERIEQLGQGKEVPLLEEKFIRLDGTIVDVEVAASPIVLQDEPLVQVIAREITERKRMEEALRQSEEGAKRLAQENAIFAEIGRIISSTLNVDQVYDHFAETVRKLIPFDRISINVVNSDNRTFHIPYAAGLHTQGREKGDVIPLVGTASQEVFRTRSSLLIRNLDEFVSRFPGLLPLVETGFQSMMLIPLIAQDRLVGILNLQLTNAPFYNEQCLQVAENIATQIAGAIANAQLFNEFKEAEKALRKSEDEAKRLSQENTIIAEIGRIISSTLSIEEVYDRFAAAVSKLISLDRICIGIMHGAAMVENAYVWGVQVSDRKVGDLYPAGSISEEIMRTGKSVLVQTEDQDEIMRSFPRLVTTFQAGLRSMLSVPLTYQDRVIGILHIRSLTSKAYSKKDVRLAEQVGNQIAGAIAAASLYRELKEAKETLQKKEEEFRELYDHAPLGYHEYDREGRITRVNQTDLEMLGYQAEEMVGQPMWKFNVEEVSKEQILAKLAGRIPPGRNLVRTYRRKDGSYLPVLIEDRLLKDEKGEITGVRCTIQDITERQRMEEALRWSEEEAKRLAQENATIAEIGRIISSNLNIEEVYSLFSKKVRNLLPYDRIALNLISEDGTKLINGYVHGLLVPERNVGEVQQKAGTLTEAVILNRKGLILEIQNEKQISAKYPGLLPEFRAGLRSFLSVPLISGDQAIGGLHFRSQSYGVYSQRDLNIAQSIANQVAGAVANALLFSKHTKVEKERISLQEQLHHSQKMEAIGQLAGGIAHDFNNLLTIINTHSQMALAEIKNWDPLKEKLDAIQRAGQRAANLTKQLLAFSRRQTADMKVFDVNALLQELGNMMRRVIGEDIELRMVLDKKLGRLKADPGQIEQIIVNLVVNAKDAMPSGGVLTIETANADLDRTYTQNHLDLQPGRYVMISVNDTGVGMAPEVQKRIFEPFFTTKEKSKGTGLGLASAYGLVKQNGGDIWVYSECGQGTTFKIYFPQVDEPLEKERKKIVKAGISGGGQTILVVEDEEEVRKLAAEILTKRGYHVLEAPNGGDAFLMCQQLKEHVHLLLTDVVMPGLNGPELAGLIGHFHPGIKILFMSGYSDNLILQKGMLDSKMQYLQKPFSVDGLLEKIQEVLDN